MDVLGRSVGAEGGGMQHQRLGRCIVIAGSVGGGGGNAGRVVGRRVHEADDDVRRGAI